MPKAAVNVSDLLEQLEQIYGPQEPAWPTEPYLFLIWWHCGYPASDRACGKGWEALREQVALEPEAILASSPDLLAKALRAGGMVPELRALRLKEIAARVKDEFAGDLLGALKGPLPAVRARLKKFPNIADPGADRILLFAGLAPVAAVPSNCPHVLVRIRRGRERENYGATYREAQEEIETGVPEKFDGRTRAFLLLKRHGQEVCKLTKPKCAQCGLSSACAYFAGSTRGRAID
jgi:endonuclease III